ESVTTTTEIATTTTAATTTSTTTPDATAIRWQLASDFGRHPSDNPFSRTAHGPRIWSLRYGPTLERTGTYPLLPRFARTLRPGIAAWHGTNDACGGLPAVGVTGSKAGTVCGATVPEHAVFASPVHDELAVVGWQSPIAGDVVIAAGLGDL